MKVKRIFFWLLLLTCQGEGQAQELKIGSKFPITTLKDLYNSDKDSIEIAPGKSRLWLLELWGTGCLACVKSFPKLDSIQSRFGKSVQIILINKESRDSTLKYLAKRKGINLPKNIPLFSGDTLFSQLFPYLYVPHLVWLDSTNTVMSITYGENATIPNVSKYLQGDQLTLVEKRDTIYKDYSDDLMVAQLAIENDALEYFSYLTKYIPGLSSGSRVKNNTQDGRINQIHVDQATILELYKRAYSEWYKFPFFLHSNSVVLKIQDSAKYIPPEDINLFYNWREKNKYSYRLLVPEEKASQLFVFMKRDLERLFGLSARIVPKKIPCFVLEEGEYPRILGGEHNIDSSNCLKFTWSRFTWLLKSRIDNEASPEPFVNLTKINNDFLVYIHKQNWKDWNSSYLNPLAEELKKYGLTITKRPHEMDVLILSDEGDK